jgi:hypothetical protein
MQGITYHVWRLLQAAGYNYVDQVAMLPTSKLSEIIQTPKSLKSLLKALGRDADISAIYGESSIEVDGHVLDMAPLKAMAQLRGTARRFRFQDVDEMKAAIKSGSRTDPDTGMTVAFGWLDIARYKLERDAIKEAQAAEVERVSKAADGDAAPPQAAALSVDEAVAQRMKEYSEDYDTSQWTSSERKTLQWLASMEVRVENLQGIQLRGDVVSELAAKQRSEEIERLLNQIRKLRDDLQISLKSRIEAGRQKASEDVIKDLASRGKRLFSERASILQHCGILQGFFLPNFPAHVDTKSITVRCGKCGQPVQWQLVTQGMLDLYTEAGEFVPSDAPPGMFQR